MLQTNVDNLIKISVQGYIKHPITANSFYLTEDGKGILLPSMGGIVYNVKVGDSAFGWCGDHIEPGVTIKNEDDEANDALTTLACIGNEAIVVSGAAKGEKGYVSGKHGYVEHILICFEQEILEKLTLGDTILIKAVGQGLALQDFKDVSIMNIDPNLFQKLGIKYEDEVLKVPIKAEIPSHFMGSGIGGATSYRGDYDIMTTDRNEIKKFGIDKLKLGDIILIRDWENTYGRAYMKGAVSIGIVIHTDSIRMGHGPGVTTIMSCRGNRSGNIIKGVYSENANISIL